MIVHLHPNLKLLADITADKEHARFAATTAVHVLEEPNGFYRCEATDGHALVIVRGPSEDRQAGIQADNTAAALVDGRDWKEAFTSLLKGLPGKGKKEDHRLTLATVTAEAYQFASPVGVRPGQNTQGRFPDVNRVLPSQAPRYSVRVDPELVIAVLKVAGALREEGGIAVTLHFWPNPHGGMVGVTMRNGHTGQALDSVFLPLNP